MQVDRHCNFESELADLTTCKGQWMFSNVVWAFDQHYSHHVHIRESIVSSDRDVE
jgi:hypothetical protein